MAQEQKPKKTIRKKTVKPAQPVRTPKRYKKKKKQIESSDSLDDMQLPLSELQQHQPQQIRSSPKLFTPTLMNNVSWNQTIKAKTIDHIDVMPKSIANIPVSIGDYIIDSPSKYHYSSIQPNLTNLQQQELFTVCENSSAYESSEDTGVGGLSESELISASDGIG